MENCNVLIGRKAICDHLKIGRGMFYALIENGAPITKITGGWVSHKELLDDYFRSTVKDGSKITPPGPA